MQELLVWELSGHSSFKGIIEERERIGYKLQEELNSYLDRGGDNNMSIAIIISAINYIVLFTRQYHKINGIDFSKPEAWERMEAMISTYAVSYSFCNGAGKKLYFHMRQDENRYQMDGGTQGWKDIPTYGTRW